MSQRRLLRTRATFCRTSNVAIKASAAARFLEAHSVGYRAASGGTKLDLPAIADMARRFTALIVCQ